MKKFGGKALFLNRDNINTDEIIPAKYLTFIEKEPLKPHLLEDLKMDDFDPEEQNWQEIKTIVSKKNFGSGSSREMAVWAFEVNDIDLIVASNFARIFRENCFNNGLLAIELGENAMDEIFQKFGNKEDVQIFADIKNLQLTVKRGNEEEISYKFSLGKFKKDLVQAGGWVDLAQKKY